MKDGELPAGIVRVEGQKTADFSAAAALSAVRMLGFSAYGIAGAVPGNMEQAEWSVQAGALAVTPYGGGLIALVYPKPFPKSVVALFLQTENGAALGFDSASLAGARVKRVDGQNAYTILCWIAVGC